MSMYLTEPDSADPGRVREHVRDEPPTCTRCGSPIGPLGSFADPTLGVFCSFSCKRMAILDAAQQRERVNADQFFSRR